MTRLDDLTSNAIGSNGASATKNSNDRSSSDIFSRDSKQKSDLISIENDSKERAYLGQNEISLITTNKHNNGNSDKNNTDTLQMEKEEVSDLTRLPKSVIPKRYELKLNIGNPDNLEYSGEVNIRIYFNENVDTIWLHSKRLEITNAFIQSSQLQSQTPHDAVEIIDKPEKEVIGLKFECPFHAGTRAWLGISFRGEISRNLEGFFSTPFVERNTGVSRLGASTMFAATEARSCFPCFDEPDFKAIFAIETTVDEDLTVISNMPIMDSKVSSEGGKYEKKQRTDFFEWTKEMSSYLVCIVIGQYDYVEGYEPGLNTLVRVHTPCGQRENGRFALEVARKCLTYFNAYFGKPYPLPKLDLIALSRLSVGAMENWGLITCRETGLIVDLTDTNPSALQKIATLIAHEVSHQWFGNLVTMKWWDFLYLNEGFATFMQYLCIDAIFPQFNVFNQFCSDTLVPALGMDALENSHPIEVPLSDASEISQVFDKITYCKGASVINMLHQFVGPEQFKLGIQNYLQNFSYGNATTEDLWEFLSSSSSLDVGSIMNAWIRELGFPIVRVSLRRKEENLSSSENNTNNNRSSILHLSQERFSNSTAASRYNGIWSIPIQGIYMKDGFQLEKFEFLFDKDSQEIELEGFVEDDPASWLKLNPCLNGFYRVFYCDSLFRNLFANLDSKHLTSIDRMGLFDDQVAMVLCEETGDTVRILRMAQTFREYERSITVWRSVLGILHQIRTLTWSKSTNFGRPASSDGASLLADRYDTFVKSIYKPLLNELGFNQPPPLLLPQAKSPSDTAPTVSSSSKVRKQSDAQANATAQSDASQLRSLLYWHLAAYGDEEVREHAKELFQSHVDGSAPIPGSMRGAVYKAVMTTATQTTYVQFKNLFRETESAEERSRILAAFGYCEDPNILSQILDFCMDSQQTHAQEAVVAILSLASNRVGARHAWNFFVANIDQIVARYSGGLFLMSRLVKSVTESFSDHESFQEAVDFFEANDGKFVGSENAVKQALEHVRLNVTWRDKDIDAIRRFLDSNESIEF